MELTSKETAYMLGIANSTLKRWRGERRGPRYYKRGVRVVYFKAEVEQWRIESLRPVDTEDFSGSQSSADAELDIQDGPSMVVAPGYARAVLEQVES